MLCISSPFTEPYFNLATEEFLLQHFTDDIFMLWRNEPAIIVGKFQNTAAEINLDFVKEKHIKVVRRLTGGGAVFHDLGNLNYTFIEAGSHRDFKAFTEPIIAFLQSLGVAATFEGRNDLMIDGQKFSGTAQCVFNDKTLHHGTLLFSSEMEDISAALKVNPLKFQDKAVKSVRKRVTNISDHLPQKMEIKEFTSELMNYVRSHSTDTQEYTFSDEDVRAIGRLRDEKYATWEWNFGSSPQFNYTKAIRTAAGTVEVDMSILKGRITDIHFCGDFFSPSDITELEQAFVNQPYREENIQKVLSKIQIGNYITHLTNEDVMKVMF